MRQHDLLYYPMHDYNNLLYLKDALDEYLNTLDRDKDREEYKAIDEDCLCILDIRALIEQLTEKFQDNKKYQKILGDYLDSLK